MPESAQYMYGVPTPRYSPLATSLSRTLTQHYQSFIAFQQHAMVMSQMLASLNRRRSQSPDSSVQLVSSTLPHHFTFSPTDDHRLQLPSTFPELDEYSPLSLKAQSDQGYCSSVTSESRSKVSRLSGGSETSGKSRNWLISPDFTKSRSIMPPSSFDENSQASYDSASVQTPEISSSVDIPSTLLDDDSRKSMSKYLPSFCDETSNQSLPECGVEIKIEPLSPQSSSRSSPCNGSPHIEIDYASNIKEEIDAPVSFLNSDVMWSVSPEKSRRASQRFVPSPEKSSNDCSMDMSVYQSYFSKSRRLSSPVQGTVPFVSPFTPCEAQLSSKHGSPDDLQTEAIDLSVPKKRKAKTQTKENLKKRHKKESKKKFTLQKDEVNDQSLQENKDTKQGQFVLQISKLLNLNNAKKKTIKQNKINEDSCKPPNSKPNSVKPTSIKTPSVKPTSIKLASSKPSSIAPTSTKPTNSGPTLSKPAISEPTISKPTSIKPSKSKPTTEKKRVQGDNGKDKKFKCKVCEKNYSQRSSLHTHMRIHTGVRPYECKDCGRSFTDCSTYIKHCRLHTGEKPYACSVCGRCFTQSGNMMRHQEKCKMKTLDM